jgi:hypothetical protein
MVFSTYRDSFLNFHIKIQNVIMNFAFIDLYEISLNNIYGPTFIQIQLAQQKQKEVRF